MEVHSEGAARVQRSQINYDSLLDQVAIIPITYPKSPNPHIPITYPITYHNHTQSQDLIPLFTSNVAFIFHRHTPVTAVIARA